MTEKLNDNEVMNSVQRQDDQVTKTAKKFIDDFAAVGEIIKDKSGEEFITVNHSEEEDYYQSEVKILEGGIRLSYSPETDVINVEKTDAKLEQQLINVLRIDGNSIIYLNTNEEVTPYDILNYFKLTDSIKSII